MAGGTGSDSYVVDQVNDEIIENAAEGTDDVTVLVNNYVLRPNVEVGAVGTSFGLMLSGSQDNNTLFGNTGKDRLFGGDGNDAFGAGAGNGLSRV